MNPARKKAYLALIIAQLIWGASQPLAKSALELVSPAQFLFLRYLIAAPLAIPLIIRGLTHYRHSLTEFARIIVIETISLINLFLIFTALTHITALQSALILQTRPIFITLGGLIILNETIERHEWLGLLLSVLGTFTIMARPFFLHPDGFTSTSFIGVSILLVANIINAANILLSKKYYAKISKSAISGLHMWIGLLIFGPYVLLTNNVPDLSMVATTPQILLPLLYMAMLGSIVALTLSTYSLSRIEASEATIFHYLQPLVYIPLSVLWLRETITSPQLLGMALILAGVSYAASRPKIHTLRHGIPLLNRLRPTRPTPPHPHMHRI